MRLLWLPDVLRAAGLTVREVDGWQRRGSDSYGPVRGITCHATAGSRRSTDASEIGVLLNGSETAPAPIAQLYLSRTGTWFVVASGTCYHNKTGWAGPNKGYGNDNLLGIEAQHSNTTDEPWTEVQYRSYARGVAALVRHKASGYDVPLAHVAGHKEHQPGSKSDPTFSMAKFRADVAAVLAGEDDDMPTAREVWQTDGLIEAPRTREDQDNTHWTPAAVLNDADNHARAAAVDAKAAREAAERAAAAAERAASQQPQPIDYDRLALALLRNMAAPSQG